MRAWISLALVLCLGASAAAQNNKKRHINLPNKNVNAPFSDAVLVGDTLYIAGRIGLDPKTGKVPDDPEQEARNVLDGFKAVLAQADMTMDDLVTVQVFCSDVSLFDKWNGVYRSYFKKDFPARAFIGSGKLLFNARFEMQGTAVKGGVAALRKKAPSSEPIHGN
ncbi:MAG TPA: Rid family hydrolase [Terriglobales bacterium]